MRFESPLRDRHSEAAVRQPGQAAARASRPGAATGSRLQGVEVSYLPYGPADERGRAVCEVVAGFGDLEAEYAAVRNGVAVLDCPNRGMIIVGGPEGRAWIDRLVTQGLADLTAGLLREGFLLNRKGRIEADLAILDRGDDLLLLLDVHDAARVTTILDGFLFGEDVTLRDGSDDLHQLALHGPAASDLLASVAEGAAPAGPDTVTRVTIAGVLTTVARRDAAGVPGLELITKRAEAIEVWETLLGAAVSRHRSRPAGWHALNIARIEAGTPIYHVDFGPENLPHETGLLEMRVSFTKGCYPGQEIVARTQNLGKPRQKLVGLRPEVDRLPEAGSEIFAEGVEEDQADAKGVGVVTSSTLSPMLGAQPIALAMLRNELCEPGTVVQVQAEETWVRARVGPLRSLPPEPTS